MNGRDAVTTTPNGSERDIAARIRAAADQLLAAIDDAHDAGLSVHFGIATRIGGPSTTRISGLRIAREPNWTRDFKGYEL